MRVWSYPEGDDTRRAFDTAVLFGQRLTREAQLAPDPQAMLEAISSNTTAIGYLPERWVQNNPGVRSVSLNQKLAEALRQPVLALSEGEPVGNVRTLLLCLQSRLSSGTK
jgi:ABC-type phosphate transport system substrate-binding protein